MSIFMKKVLLISYFFSQKDSIGAVRLLGLAKFLPRFGWNPIILTVRSDSIMNDQFKVVEVDSIDSLDRWRNICRLNSKNSDKGQLESGININNIILNKLKNFFLEIFFYPDVTKSWCRLAIEKGDKIIEQEGIDAIVSSSSPITTHIIASHLRGKYRIPWIADFRDLWTQNHFYPYSPIRKYFEKQLEQRTLSNADALVTVSTPLAEKLEKLHNDKSIYAITNGFDPDNLVTFDLAPNVTVSNDFSITYTGYLYRGKQNVEIFLKSIKKLIKMGVIKQDLVINFYGYNEGWLEADVKEYDLMDVVHVYSSISRAEAIKKQRESQLLLLFGWDDLRERGIYTGKIFDYLAARRPILSIGPSGDVIEALLNHTSAGINVVNSEDLEYYIVKFYNEFKSYGRVSYTGLDLNVNMYSQLNMAKKFSKLLDDLTSKESDLYSCPKINSNLGAHDVSQNNF